MLNKRQNITFKEWLPVAHSNPDEWYRKKLKKVPFIPGTVCEVFRFIQKYIQF